MTELYEDQAGEREQEAQPPGERGLGLGEVRKSG